MLPREPGQPSPRGSARGAVDLGLEAAVGPRWRVLAS